MSAVDLTAAAERLLGQVQHEAYRPGDPPPPEPRQVAMVLHALADHTALEQARTYSRHDRPLLSDPTDAPLVEGPWPTSTSIGRWLHDVGTRITDRDAGLT